MAALLMSSRKLLLLTASLFHFCSRTVWANPHTARSESLLRQEVSRVFDYVIVGGGPGGLVMANRLTENPSVSVAIIEAGTWPEDVVGNQTEVPAYNFYFDLKAANATYSGVDWGFVTTPQAGMYGHVIRYPRGKALGGSTNLNAMAWADSCKGAFERWADVVGDQSYTYDNVAKYYRKAMNFTPPNMDTRLANATPSYNHALVAEGGPLDVSYPAYAYSWTTWVGVALEGIGLKKTDSFINGALNGSAWHMSTINHTTGFRASADRAYLRPYLQRPNMAVFNGTLGERIIFDNDKVATGVVVTTGNTSYTLNASREVIVAGGVFQSPQLLQVSGVGNAALLQEHGIRVIADRPGVGQNLNDQFFFGIAYRVNLETSTSLSRGDNIAIDVKKFNTNATGRLTSPGGEYSGFEKVPEDLRSNFSASTLKILAEFPEDWPEIEYVALPGFVGDLESSPSPTDDFNYATLLATLMAPTSRGNVSIQSPRMSDPPLINPNVLTTQSDIEVSIAMFKRLRQAWTVPALAVNLTIGDEYYPGLSIQTDEEIEQLIRSTLSPVSHASATCKMGKADDELAVVDSHGKVYGVKNLRVVDASAFPFLVPGTAPQAAVYMLAEKIADDVKNGN